MHGTSRHSMWGLEKTQLLNFIKFQENVLCECWMDNFHVNPSHRMITTSTHHGELQLPCNLHQSTRVLRPFPIPKEQIGFTIGLSYRASNTKWLAMSPCKKSIHVWDAFCIITSEQWDYWVPASMGCSVFDVHLEEVFNDYNIYSQRWGQTASSWDFGHPHDFSARL